MLIDGPRPFGITDPGAAYDLRPGVATQKWTLDNLYAWPVPKGPQPVTLMPDFAHPDWGTTVEEDGVFERWRLSKFNTTGAWEEYPRLHAEDWVLVPKTSGATIETTSVLHDGGSFWFNFKVPGPQLEGKEIWRVSFGDTVDEERYTLIAYENGLCHLYKGYDTDEQVFLKKDYLIPATQGTLADNKWHTVVVFPFRRNSMLIKCFAGNKGMVYTNGKFSIEPTTNASGRATKGNGTLTGAGTVKWTIPDLPKVPLIQPKFTAYSLMDSKQTATPHPDLTAAPVWSAATAPVLGGFDNSPKRRDLLGVDIDEDDFIIETPTVDFHENKPYIKTKVTLSRKDTAPHHKHETPVFYRVEGKVASRRDVKSNEGFSFYNDVIELTHTHSETGLSGTLKLRNAQKYKVYRRAFNIPFEFVIDGNNYLSCVCLPGKWEPKNKGNQYLEFGLTDWSKWLKTALCYDLKKLDGRQISDAVKDILISVGFNPDGSGWDIDDAPVESEEDYSKKKLHKLSEGKMDEEATNVSNVTKSAWEWLEYLQNQTSCASIPNKWVMGFRPYLNPDTLLWENRFYFKNPDKMNLTPVKEFYPDYASAVWEGAAPLNAYRAVHRGYSEEISEPEANAVFVAGLKKADTVSPTPPPEGDNAEDSETEEDAIVLPALQEDKPSQKPQTTFANRPRNWLGERRLVLYIDPALNTQALVDRVCATLFKRLRVARLKATFEAEWEPSLRLWDIVRIYHPHGECLDPDGTVTLPNNQTIEYNDWRITGFTTRQVQDNKGHGLVTWRPTTYTAERVYD
jgi:hypothetical protein